MRSVLTSVCSKTRPKRSPDGGSSSSGPSASSAAGPPARRPFPPEHQERILATVMADITRQKHLNPRRRHRTYPRVIKRARHNSYRVKRPGDHGTRHSGPATIRLVNLDLPELAA